MYPCLAACRMGGGGYVKFEEERWIRNIDITTQLHGYGDGKGQHWPGGMYILIYVCNVYYFWSVIFVDDFIV